MEKGTLNDIGSELLPNIQCQWYFVISKVSLYATFLFHVISKQLMCQTCRELLMVNKTTWDKQLIACVDQFSASENYFKMDSVWDSGFYLTESVISFTVCT